METLGFDMDYPKVRIFKDDKHIFKNVFRIAG